MKKLQNLKGAKALNKKEQQSINGGGNPQNDCEMAGGTWWEIGGNCSIDCGCVMPGDPDPPIQ